MLLTDFEILYGLSSTDKTLAIQEMVVYLAAKKELTHVEEITRSVLCREELGTTVVMAGCAIPHAKNTHIEHVCGLLAVSRQGVKWDDNAEPVRLIYLILSPVGIEIGEYLKTMAVVSIHLRSEEFKHNIFQAKNADELKSVLVNSPALEWDQRQERGVTKTHNFE